MRNPRSPGSGLGPLLAVALLLAVLPAARAGYPAATDPFVNDFAGLLTAADAATLRSELGALKSGTGIEAVVVTVRRLSDHTGGSLDSFATGLFNQWGVGNAHRNDGLMLLVAKDDRKIRIEVGDGYGRRLDGVMKQVIDGEITPRFRSGQFSEGVVEGARAMVRAARRQPVVEAPAPAVSPAVPGHSAASGPPVPETPARPVEPPAPATPLLEVPEGGAAPVPPPAPEARPDEPFAPSSAPNVSPAGALGFLAALVAGIAGLVGGALKLTVRKCPRCAIKLEPLGEAEDDAFLNEGQRAEESLGSVDYEVLRCPSCQYQQMVTHSRWFSGYHDCPSCNCKTLKVESFVTEHATTMSTGRRRITRQCRHCAFADEREEIIPRRPEPSHSSTSGGSSRSSFGGGRSSGGGASGSW